MASSALSRVPVALGYDGTSVATTTGNEMPDVFSEGWQEILARPDGPLAFRFYLQPLVAIALAVRDGIQDARHGRPAYFWSLFSDRAGRRERLRHGWRAIKKVFVVALLIDLIYQLIVIRALRPIEALLVATALAIVPYLAVRGPVNRVTRRLRGRKAAGPPAQHTA